MIKIQADWIKYNANTRNKNVGDCVKRALSYAYGVDYDEISRQLNRHKRDHGYAAYNNTVNWREFILDNGATRIPDSECKGMTEQEFSEKFNSGVYLVRTGKTISSPAHLVCIFNGDIVDSWNSSEYVVVEGYKLSNVSLDVSLFCWEDIRDPLLDFIRSYCEDVSKKWDKYFEVELGEDFRVDELTRRLYFYLSTKQLPEDSDYPSFEKYLKRIVVKMNPRLSIEGNIESLKVQLKGRVYNWIYPVEKDIKDSISVSNIQNDHGNYLDNPSEKKLLLKLPEWSRPYVRYFVTPETDYLDYGGYYLEMDKLPEDQRPGSSYVSFSRTNLKSLIAAVEAYKAQVEGRPILHG